MSARVCLVQVFQPAANAASRARARPLRRYLQRNCRCCEHGIIDRPSWQAPNQVRFMNIGRPQRRLEAELVRALEAVRQALRS